MNDITYPQRARDICDLLETYQRSITQVAQKYSISRQRVHQIVAKTGSDVLHRRKIYRTEQSQRQRQQRKETATRIKQEALRAQKCAVCEQEFTFDSRRGLRRFCSRDCRRLYYSYLRYYLDTSRRYEQATWIVTHPDKVSGSELRYANKVIKSWKETGTYTVRHRDLALPVVARALAKKVGVTLAEVRDRLIKEKEKDS